VIAECYLDRPCFSSCSSCSCRMIMTGVLDFRYFYFGCYTSRIEQSRETMISSSLKHFLVPLLILFFRGCMWWSVGMVWCWRRTIPTTSPHRLYLRRSFQWFPGISPVVLTTENDHNLPPRCRMNTKPHTKRKLLTRRTSSAYHCTHICRSDTMYLFK
jgi:hypothetical protein